MLVSKISVFKYNNLKSDNSHKSTNYAAKSCNLNAGDSFSFTGGELIYLKLYLYDDIVKSIQGFNKELRKTRPLIRTADDINVILDRGGLSSDLYGLAVISKEGKLLYNIDGAGEKGIWTVVPYRAKPNLEWDDYIETGERDVVKINNDLRNYINILKTGKY